MDALTTDTPEGFVNDAALAVVGVLPLADVQAKHRMDDDALDAAAAANETAIAKRAAEITAAGEDIPHAAVGTLRSLVEQLNQHAQSGQMPTSTMIRCAELMHKVSGLEAKQRRAVEVEPQRFIININTGITGAPQVHLEGATVAAEVVDTKPDPLASVREALTHDD